MAKPFLTATEVADMLQMNVETIYSLISRDNLPAARVGGRWRFDEQMVRSWVASKSKPQCSEDSADIAVGQQ